MVMGIAVPILVFPRIIRERGRSLLDLPLAVTGLIYLLSNFHVIIAMAIFGKQVHAADYFFRVLNGYLGLFMFQWYVRDEKTYKRLLLAMDLSYLTSRTVVTNLFLAFAYNVLALPAALVGLVNPVIAVTAMLLSSLTVVGNSARIARQTRG